MNSLQSEQRPLVLVVDDSVSIHQDLRKILGQDHSGAEELRRVERNLFGGQAEPREIVGLSCRLDSAFQGEEALERVKGSVSEGQPYALAIVDVRMPPGWDGVETVRRLWAADPDLHVILCTAYSDFAWSEVVERLGSSDQLAILKKPFDTVEVMQLANALMVKWRLHREARERLEQLEHLVRERTRSLETSNRRLQSEIEEHRRAAEALRQSEARYETMFAKNPLPMLVIELPGLRLLAANETAVQEYGYSAEEFLALTVADLRLPEEKVLLRQKLERVRDSGQTGSSYLTRHRKKNGSVIDVEIISRVLTFGGRQAKLVLINDLTQRRAAEERLREQAALMEQI